MHMGLLSVRKPCLKGGKILEMAHVRNTAFAKRPQADLCRENHHNGQSSRVPAVGILNHAAETTYNLNSSHESRIISDIPGYRKCTSFTLPHLPENLFDHMINV